MIIYGLWSGIPVENDVKAERYVFAFCCKLNLQNRKSISHTFMILHEYENNSKAFLKESVWELDSKV
jgi:hypothetical protein